MRGWPLAVHTACCIRDTFQLHVNHSPSSLKHQPTALPAPNKCCLLSVPSVWNAFSSTSISACERSYSLSKPSLLLHEAFSHSCSQSKLSSTWPQPLHECQVHCIYFLTLLQAFSNLSKCKQVSPLFIPTAQYNVPQRAVCIR